MSNLDLGSLVAKLTMDTAGLMSGVRDAQNALGRIDTAAEQTAKKTEDVGKTLQKALKGEVLVGAANRLSGALGSLGKEYEGLSRAAQGAGAILQGLFQGGVIGAGIAAAGVGVSALVKQWGEAEANAKRVAQVFAEDLASQTKALDTVLDRLRAVNAEAASVRAETATIVASMSTGLSAGTVGLFGSMDAAESAVSRRRANVEMLRAGVARAPNAEARSLVEQDLRVATAALMEAEAGLSALEAVLDKQIASDRAAGEQRRQEARNARRKEMSDAVSQARGWRPDGLLTLGAAIRQQRDLDSFGIDGPGSSIRREAAERAERNAGYRANAAETVFGDGDQARMAAREESRQRHVRPGESFATAANHATNDAYTQMVQEHAKRVAETLENFKGAVSNAVQALAGVAPKTTQIVSSLLTGDVMGAIAQALSHSKEGQALGKALDTGLVDIINAITELLRPAVPVLTMAIRAVVEAFKIVGDIVGLVMQISGVNQALAIVFEVVKGLAAGIAAGAAATQWALNALQNSVREGGIAFLSMFGDAFKAQIADLRAGMVTQGGILETMGAAFDAVWSIGFNAEQAAIGMGDAADAANRVAQSFLNLPAGFKVAQAMFDATSASSAPFGGFMPPVTSPQLPAVAAGVAPTMGPTGGGDIFNFYGPIYVSGDEGFTNVVTVSARQNGMATSGTDSGGARTQRPTAYAPTPTPP